MRGAADRRGLVAPTEKLLLRVQEFRVEKLKQKPGLFRKVRQILQPGVAKILLVACSNHGHSS